MENNNCHFQVGSLVTANLSRQLALPISIGANYGLNPYSRVFLCFYSAIFQLTSAKFQTFAYNSRTV